MDKYWQFAKQMLRYKKLLLLAAGGALLDALCGFAGFGMLPWIFRLLVNGDGLRELLVRDDVVDWVGDLSWLAGYVSEDKFYGFAQLVGVILVLAALGATGRIIHLYNVYTVSMSTVMRIRKTMYQRLVHLPMARFSEDGTADYLSRMVRDCGQLARGFDVLFGKSIRHILQGCGCLLLALLTNWQLTLFFLLGMPVVGLVIYRFGRIVRKSTWRALRQSAKMVGSIQESLQSILVVKVHQAEGYERRRFNSINRNMFRAEIRSRMARVMSSPIVEYAAIVGVLGVALTASWMVFREGQKAEELVLVLVYFGIAAAALKPIVNLNNDLQEAAAAATRVDQLLKLETEPNTRGTANRHEALPRHMRSICFEDVQFIYSTGTTPALAGVSIRVDYGQVCAIVGGNGSGKSTLLAMLPRLYVPNSGRVLIDDCDIQKYSLRSVRGQMAMVTQETVLFDGTIGENLTYGSRHVPREVMIEAAKRAHADEFIKEMPDGYETEIGEWGGRLSGGQRQRIAIARAILRDPAILILDEATSQIDADSEAKIADALNKFVTNRTTFIIAHRLSTVVDADVIVVMDEGRVVDRGKHVELLDRCDIYRTLCQTQLMKME